jgi:vacuolar-type H+-ATPase subunit E/Vma4
VTDEQIEKSIERAVTEVKRAAEEAAKYAGEESRRHLETFVERIEHKIDSVFEGYINTNQRVDRLKVTVEDHEERITDLETSKR